MKTILIAITFLTLITSSAWIHAQEFTLLYSFEDAPDGANPDGGLSVVGSSGYGTTYHGGAYGYNNQGLGYGTIFKMIASGRETVIHNFASSPDGANPSGPLTPDTAGNLYGTTQQGGSGCAPAGCGTVYKIDPAGNETVLYRFQAGTDGAAPYAGVILDSQGNIYGTTMGGGSYGTGTVFRLDTGGHETVLHNFGGPGDGADLAGTLVLDSAGNLYGTTLVGGACPQEGGTVFKIDAASNETILYSFCGGASTGSSPTGNLLRDAAGNLYGVTGQSGDDCPAGDGDGCGTVFELTASGQLRVLHAFNGGATDGAFPTGITAGASGVLYGSTSAGGSNDTAGLGTLFQLSRSGFSLIHVFEGGNQDGAMPLAPPLFLAGSLYGTTNLGGASSNGSVYKFALK